MPACEGSGTVVQDTALVLGVDPDRYIECPVCHLQYSLPFGGDWGSPTIPGHEQQAAYPLNLPTAVAEAAEATGVAFDAFAGIASAVDAESNAFGYDATVTIA